MVKEDRTSCHCKNSRKASRNEDLNWKAISLEESKKIKSLAIKTAKAYGFPQMADDLSQELLIAKSKGKLVRANFVMIDLLRREFGAAQTKNNSLRKAQHLSYSQLDENDLTQETYEHNYESVIDMVHNKNLDEKEMAVAILKFVFEFKLKEIALVFNLNESRISQIFSSLIYKLKE